MASQIYQMFTLKRGMPSLLFGCLIALWLAIYMVSYLNPIKYEVEFQEPKYGDHIIGIDLGESYERIGVVRNGVFEMIPEKQGRTAIPSYVSFPEIGESMIGFDAKEQVSVNSKNTFYDVRSLVGRNFQDLEVQEAITDLPYEVDNQDGDIKLRIHTNGEDNVVTLEDVMTMMFQDLKSMAEEYLNTTISHAVVPLPDSFSERQVQSVKEAASRAGLDAIRMHSRSRSVGVAHNFDQSTGESVYLVCDADSKGLELSLVSVDRGLLEVISNVKDMYTRGSDIKLSGSEQQTVLATSKNLELVRKLLSDSKLQLNQVDDILIFGNSERTVEAQALLEILFGKKALIPVGFPNAEAVVYRAAFQGDAIINDKGSVCCFGDVTPLDVGIETSTGDLVRVVPRNWVFPTRKYINVTTVGENQEDVTNRILEGAQGKAFGNLVLGTLSLTRPPQEPKGVLEIEICFQLDANGILEVTAKCERSIDTLRIEARKYTQYEIESLLAQVDEHVESQIGQGMESSSLRRMVWLSISRNRNPPGHFLPGSPAAIKNEDQLYQYKKNEPMVSDNLAILSMVFMMYLFTCTTVLLIYVIDDSNSSHFLFYHQTHKGNQEMY